MSWYRHQASAAQLWDWELFTRPKKKFERHQVWVWGVGDEAPMVWGWDGGINF